MDILISIVTTYPAETALTLLAALIVLAVARWWRRNFASAQRVRIGGQTHKLSMRDVSAIYASMNETQKLLHQQRIRNGADPWQEHTFQQAAIRYLIDTGRWRD